MARLATELIRLLHLLHKVKPLMMLLMFAKHLGLITTIWTYNFRVKPDTSEDVQLALFKMGYQWSGHNEGLI